MSNNNVLNKQLYRCTVIFLLLFFSGYGVAKARSEWTWLYKKRFTKQQKAENSKSKVLLFKKGSVSPFTQLVFSWNAFRPQEGHFSFFVKVRDVKTKEWGRWHKMIDWGQSIQRSYFSSGDKNRKYIYVRLETGNVCLADGFMIKIVSSTGNGNELVNGFSVCVSNFSDFKSEKKSTAFVGLPSVYVRSVPRLSQMVLDHPRARHMCSTTSCSMLTSFFSKKEVDPLDFAQKAFDRGLNAYGSWPFNTAHAFERCEGKQFFSVARLPSFKHLHRFLMQKKPVVVSVRGALKGAPKVYDKGHLLLVVGWDGKRSQIICHDPAMEKQKKVLKRYDIGSFLSAWERSHRLAYISEPII